MPWVKAFGARNEDGQRKADFADHGFVLVNTWLIKLLSRLPRFDSRNSKMQLDYILKKRRDFIIVIKREAVRYETIAFQQRPLIFVLQIWPPIKSIMNILTCRAINGGNFSKGGGKKRVFRRWPNLQERKAGSNESERCYPHGSLRKFLR